MTTGSGFLHDTNVFLLFPELGISQFIYKSSEGRGVQPSPRSELEVGALILQPPHVPRLWGCRLRVWLQVALQSLPPLV